MVRPLSGGAKNWLISCGRQLRFHGNPSVTNHRSRQQHRFHRVLSSRVHFLDKGRLARHAPTDQLPLLLGQGRIDPPCRIGLANRVIRLSTRLGSGHCGLQGLPAREKAVGGQWCREGWLASLSHGYCLLVTARHELIHGWKVRQRLRAFHGLYCQRAQPAVLDVLD